MKNNIVKSITYLEFVNQITSLVNDLLYSSQNGYVYWSAKKAVLDFDDVVKKYDNESLKLAKNLNTSDVDLVLKSKKYSLVSVMQKHYEKQILIWADEVFDKLVDNCFFELSINKNKSDEIFKQLVSSINWLCDVKKIDKSAYKALLENYTKKFNSVLNTADSDYLPVLPVDKSSEKEFYFLWKMALEKTDDFLKIDFNEYSAKISAKDINYFEELKTKLNTYKKTSTIDELALISSALDAFKIAKFEEIYKFIYEINNDFADSTEKQKNMTEQEKIVLIKRRAQLFLDKNKTCKDYFKKLIIS